MTGGRTSESHPITVDFVELDPAVAAGRLGLTFGPGKKGPSYHSAGGWNRDVDADLDVLVGKYGLSVLVSLMEDHEYEFLQMTDLFPAVEARKRELIHYPIVDVSVPPADAMPGFAELVTRIRTLLTAGETVIVHCRGGMGRTGLVAAAVLAAGGMEADEAIAAVRRARPGTLETPAQEDYVRSYQRYAEGSKR